MLCKMIWIVFLLFTAVGVGLYVYPGHPVLVWGMLALFWGCYRLSLRARMLFDKPQHTGRD